MPLYEYQCDSCGKTFEIIQKFSDQPLNVHEGCGGAVERLLSRPALHFKGSGWYITDYARSGAKSDSNGESKPAGAQDSKTSESKPAESKPVESKPAAKNSSSDK